ncbi:Protein of unknown function [Gryllus bimaculatus]|nr:Protein of unknown function [Gryllus bimaculatus]
MGKSSQKELTKAYNDLNDVGDASFITQWDIIPKLKDYSFMELPSFYITSGHKNSEKEKEPCCIISITLKGFFPPVLANWYLLLVPLLVYWSPFYPIQVLHDSLNEQATVCVILELDPSTMNIYLQDICKITSTERGSEDTIVKMYKSITSIPDVQHQGTEGKLVQSRKRPEHQLPGYSDERSDGQRLAILSPEECENLPGYGSMDQGTPVLQMTPGQLHQNRPPGTASQRNPVHLTGPQQHLLVA